MPLDALCLTAVAAELRAAVAGGKIDKLYQPTRDEVVLYVRGQGENVRLLLSANPGHPRANLTTLNRENPEQPPMFCMLLRKHLQGARILELNQPPLERILEFRLETLDELGDRVERRLVLEAMGRSANLLLLDGEGRIIDCIRRVDGDLGRGQRQLLPGLFYRQPPEPDKLNPFTIEPEELRLVLENPLGKEWDKLLLDSFTGLSPLVARELAFRAAEQGRPGSAFVSLPQDVVDGPVSGKVLPASGAPQMGAAPDDAIDQVAKLIAQAKNPIFLLGLMASQPENSKALRRLLETSHIPVTSTYQAAGAVNQDNFSRFAGRVGLFNNQAGDRLLQLADLVICIGYSPVEYEPAMWNSGNATLVHIDVLPAYEERNYTPDVELVGDIAGTLNKLAQNIDHRLVLSPQAAEILRDRQHQRELLDRRGAQLNQFALHPLRIVRAMQDIVNSDVTLTVDMGSFHIWIARYLYSFRARQVMISNGQQTMGVALPWAIGAWLVNPERKVVSVSGDGGFLQSSMELETAVRLKANVLHLIWVDNGYNMVAIQEEKKYQRLSGVEFGPMDFKAYAESFGAKGFAVESAEALEPTLRAAMDVDGPAVVAIPVDYRDNPLLMGQLHLSQIL